MFDYDKFGTNMDCMWVRLLCDMYCPRAIEFEMVREAEKKNIKGWRPMASRI